MSKLVLKSGNGQREVGLDASPLSIGRRTDNRLRVDDQFVSSRHASITFRTGRHWLEDLNSSNGTLLNGQKVSGLKALEHGDRITLGRQEYEFQVEAGVPDSTLVLPSPALAVSPEQTATLKPGAVPAASRAAPVVTKPMPKVQPAPPRPQPAPAPVTMPETPTRLSAGAGSVGRAPATDVNMLDELVGSIRSHRDRERKEQEATQALIRQQWAQTLTYAEQLKVKVQADARVKYFAVSSRTEDVMIRIQRTPVSPVEMIYVSLNHPDGRGHNLMGIWLRRSGQDDRCLRTAQEVATELVKEMAFVLA